MITWFKIRQFLRKEYWFQEKYIRKEFNDVLFRAFYFVNHDRIEGDYFEFGVYRGDSLKMAFELGKLFRLKKMRYWGFDSFCGLPEETVEKVASCFQKGCFSSKKRHAERYFSAKDLRHRVNLIEGYFKDTLSDQFFNKNDCTKAAIINIDCDLYSSAFDALKFMTPFIQTGTILIIDDWFCNKGSRQRGEQRAFYEWSKTLENRFEFIDFDRYGVHGKVFVCQKIE